MKKSSEFHDYVVLDLLEGISGITSRAMFGGYGIYKDRKIFAIITDGELYFKSSKETEEFYKSQGSHPFEYSKKDGKKYTMQYWFVPENILENREKFSEWVDTALKADSEEK